MKLHYVLSGILIFLTGAAESQTPAVCVSHFKNQSNFQWSIYNFDGQKSSVFIPPHADLAIRWGVTSTVTIRGNMPERPYVQQFSVQQSNSCVVIQSQGSTGRVTLNTPGNGDITTCVGGC